MKEYFDSIGKKLTIPVLYCLVPLAALPFLFEPDSIIGKMLLVCKFGMIALLYVFNYFNITKQHHIILGFVSLVMLVLSMRNGTFGVFFLMLILYMSFIVLPLISISKQDKKKILFLLCLAMAGVFMYAMASPISHKGFFQHKEWFIYCFCPLNANTCGYLSLATLFYFISFLDEYDFAKKNWTVILLSLIFMLIQFVTACRTVFLIIIVFVLGYLMNQKRLLKPAVYYIYLFFAFLFCIMYCLIWNQIFVSDPSAKKIQILGKELFSGRENVWLTAFSGFLNRPMLGNSTDYLLALTGFSSAHNVLLGILLVFGVTPAIIYVYFMASPEYILSIKKNQTWSLSIPQLCFIAGIISTVFECSYTDARLNYLFLPLLVMCPSEAETVERTDKMTTKQNRCFGIVCIAITLFIAVGVGAAMKKQDDNIHFVNNQNNIIITDRDSFVYLSKGTHISDGVITFENMYIAKEGEEPNKFNSVNVQLIDLDGTYIETLYAGQEIGPNKGEFALPNGLKTDYYRIKLKGNSNRQDEAAELLVYLEDTLTYSCCFDIRELSADKVELSNYTITKMLE